MSEEDLINGNITKYLETSGYPQDSSFSGLTTFQIVTFAWSLICIIPNAILIHVTSRPSLRTTNIYFMLMNLSICNVFLIVSVIPWTIVPVRLIPYKAWEASSTFFMLLITLAVIYVTAFTFEKFLTTKALCRYFIYRFWCVVGITIAVVFVSAFVEYVHIGLVLLSIGIVNIICLLILFVNIYSVYKKYEPDDNGKPVLRLIIAAYYIVPSFIERCFFVVFIVGRYDWMAMLFETFKFIIFVDGYVNMFSLVYSDSIARAIFMQLFGVKQIGDIAQ